MDVNGGGLEHERLQREVERIYAEYTVIANSSGSEEAQKHSVPNFSEWQQS